MNPIVILILLSCKLLKSQATRYYLTSTRSCAAGCTGLTAKPFDNLWNALYSVSSQSDVEIVILKTGTHYMLLRETNSASDNYTLPTSITMSGSITIRPLSCTKDSESLTTFSGKCYADTEFATVYVKSEYFRLMVNGSLKLSKIIFDNSEDIMKFNPFSQSLNLGDCIYKRKLCCSSG